jgi:hypothetical protein
MAVLVVDVFVVDLLAVLVVVVKLLFEKVKILVVDVFAVDLIAVLVVVVKLFFEKVKVLVVEVLVEVAEIFKIN